MSGIEFDKIKYEAVVNDRRIDVTPYIKYIQTSGIFGRVDAVEVTIEFPVYILAEASEVKARTE